MKIFSIHRVHLSLFVVIVVVINYLSAGNLFEAVQGTKDFIPAFRNFVSSQCMKYTNSLWNRYFWKASLLTEESTSLHCLILPVLSLCHPHLPALQEQKLLQEANACVGEGVNDRHCLIPHICANCRDSSSAFFIFLVASCWKRWEEALLLCSERGGLCTQRLDGPQASQDKRQWG